MSRKSNIPRLSEVAAPPSLPVDYAVEVIGPTQALEYLKHNAPNNRRASRATVLRFARDMATGKWRTETMDPIRFSQEGHLIDGQHRLLAIAESGATLPILVVRGVPADAIYAIDTGRARTPGDVLRIAGFRNSVLMAAALRVILLLKRYKPLELGAMATPTHTELIDAATRHPRLTESCGLIRAIGGIRPSPVVAMHYLGTHILGQPDKARQFMAVFNDGIATYEGDAAQIYRERLIRARQAKGDYDSYSHQVIMMIHVWNYFVKSRPMKLVRPQTSVVLEGLDRDLL